MVFRKQIIIGMKKVIDEYQDRMFFYAKKVLYKKDKALLNNVGFSLGDALSDLDKVLKRIKEGKLKFK